MISLSLISTSSEDVGILTGAVVWFGSVDAAGSTVLAPKGRSFVGSSTMLGVGIVTGILALVTGCVSSLGAWSLADASGWDSFPSVFGLKSSACFGRNRFVTSMSVGMSHSALRISIESEP